HVVDGASAARDEQRAEVNRVLAEIGAGAAPQVLIWNKADLTGIPPAMERDDYGRIRCVKLSARTGAGLPLLRAALGEYARGGSAMPNAPPCKF
ncbi:MAG: GTPase HflX, partial [Zoogloeaceae bacterium]|nr:GTPase HflX [Zoogloeaceae bacterium]